LLKRIAKGRSLSLLELQSIVGTLISVNDCVWATRLHINSLIELLRKALGKADGKVPPTAQVKEDLQWWLDNLEVWNGRSILPSTVDEILEVDSSGSGFGSERLPGKRWKWHTGYWTQRTRDNNVKELLSVDFGLVHYSTKWSWTNKTILIKTDNVAAMAYVNRMGGKIPALCRIAERLHNFALNRRLTVRAEWIAGKTNVEADKASRIQEDYKESQLNPMIFNWVRSNLGPLEIDLFASTENAQLKRFVTLRAQRSSYYFDALAHLFPKRGGYANPPFILIPRILQKVRAERVERLVLIAPLWTGQAWWPSLVDLLVAPPLLLPRYHALLLVNQEPRLPRWDTAAWTLSGLPSRREVCPSPLSSYYSIDTKSGRMTEVACITTNQSGDLG